MKSIIIDRVRRSTTNNWTTSRPRYYYDYTVHVVAEGDPITRETVVQTFPGNDHGDNVVMARAEAFAMKIAAVAPEGTVSIRKAWEEGQIKFLVQVFVPVVAATADEAEQMVKHALATNVIVDRARFHTEEGE